MRDGMINGFPLLIEDGIGKIIVFVDDEIKWQFMSARFIGYGIQFIPCTVHLQELIQKTIREIFLIILHKSIQLYITVTIEKRPCKEVGCLPIHKSPNKFSNWSFFLQS